MSVGAIGGGMAAMGGMASMGPAAAAPAAAAAPSAGSTGGSSAPQSSTQVTISSAAQKAMATDNQQVGASFSISSDASGHHYANGIDANGFSQMNVDITVNAMDQKFEDLVAAVLLALLLKQQQNGG